MAEDLPSIVSTFKVVGRLVRGVADSNDNGLQPEIIPVAGAIVTFTPKLSPPVFRVPTAVPPLTIYQETIIAKTNADGYLVGPNDAVPGVVLVFGGDTDLAPSGWTWTVTITPGGNFPSKTFDIYGAPDGVYDLSSLEPVPPSLGIDIAYWEQVRSEVIATVSPQVDWSGNVSLTQAETRSKYLVRRLTGNVVLSLAAGETGKAYSCTLELIQDATATARNIIVSGAATPRGVAIPLTGTPSAVDIVRLEWNGSRWAAFLGANELKVPTGW